MATEPTGATGDVAARNRRERIMRSLRSTGTVTVTDLAESLGVSAMTVRRDLNALAGRGLLTRVHGGAVLPEDVGESATGTRDTSNRPTSRFTVGLVVPQLGYYFPTIVAGARAAAVAGGVRLVLRTTGYDPQEDWHQARRLATTPGVDGLILSPDVDAPQADDLLRWLDALPQPVVLCERRAPEISNLRRLEWVVSDHAAGAASAVWHLHAQGHRRIGLLVLEQSVLAQHLRRGWRNALAAVGIDPAEQVLGFADGQISPASAGRMAEVVRACRRTGTTALVVHSDPFAIGLAQVARDAGMTVPGDLALVAYDDEVAELGDPPLSAVRPPKHDVGRMAVELMVARLTEGDRRPPHRVLVAPQLSVRGSSLSKATTRR